MSRKFLRKCTSVFLALVFAFGGFSPALAAPPDPPASISPSGDIGANNSPSFVWNEALGATEYHLWINGPSGTVLDQSYQAVNICTLGTCMVQSPVVLGDGAHTWWVQGWNLDGYGPWSSGMNFSVGTPPPANVPPNDNFAASDLISSLPFSLAVDITDATSTDEPMPCYYFMERTIWYSVEFSEDVGIHIDTLGTTLNRSLNVYRADGPGMTGLTFLNCAPEDSSIGFLAEAGQTYYFQVGSVFNQAGTIQINITQIPTPGNDNFADADLIPLPLPFDSPPQEILTASTEQPDEPTPSCAFSGLHETVWYAFTPDASGSISANVIAPFYSLLAVYAGPSLANLTELGCSGPFGAILGFYAEAGTTYYFQVGDYAGYQANGSMQLHVDVAPPPQTGFYFYPSNPSVFDTIQFYDQSYDPAGLSFQSFTWNFGDGATSTEQNSTHKYAKDGDYTVEHTVTTSDGRTGSTSQVVQVRTHDVTVTNVDALESAKVGRSEKITVSIVNSSAYPESVSVQLYRSVAGGGFEWVGNLSKSVPITKKDNKPTKFTFNYTFTADDLSIGKVIFRAEATIDNANDAFPQDNIRLSSLTMVKRR